MNRRHHRFSLGWLICGLLTGSLLSPSLALAYTTPQDATVAAIRDIVDGREKVHGYVLDVKSKYKITDPEYIEARKKYREALGKYSGWVAAVKIAIRKGKTKDLKKDAAYKTIGEDAGKALKEFVDYTESKTQVSKGILLIVSGMIEFGFKVWEGYKNLKAKERAMEADAFEKDAKWKQWEEIKGEADV